MSKTLSFLEKAARSNGKALDQRYLANCSDGSAMELECLMIDCLIPKRFDNEHLLGTKKGLTLVFE